MDNIFEEMKQVFQNFRWSDDIPEDQVRRDKICMEAKAALLIEVICASERCPAFIRLAEQAPGEKCYLLPDVVSMRDYAGFYNSNQVYTNSKTRECKQFPTLPQNCVVQYKSGCRRVKM
ncbi:MAG: hypothetical protein E7044_12235 [Lentisphaerae bacterium]|nr:hypothetical protein [Lentisphaerota bacterium]